MKGDDMRHDPYQSPWRLVFVGLVFVTLVAVIVAGVATTGRQDDSSPHPASTVTSSAGTTTITPTPSVDSVSNDELVEAVYAFVEAYNLPASTHRNDILRNLSTPEGYEMVFRDPDSQSAAEKAAGAITVMVVTGSSSVQAEPFEDEPNAMSVHVKATVRLVRDGQVLRTVQLPGQTTSWVKQSGTWKFAYLQP